MRPKPLRENLDESTSTIVFDAAFIISRFSCASSKLELVTPYSSLMPSAPIKSFEQENSSIEMSGEVPRTESDFLCTTPPSWMMLTFPTAESSIDTFSDGVTTLSVPFGTIFSAKAIMVEPVAMITESFSSSSCVAA